MITAITMITMTTSRREGGGENKTTTYMSSTAFLFLREPKSTRMIPSYSILESALGNSSITKSHPSSLMLPAIKFISGKLPSCTAEY